MKASNFNILLISLNVVEVSSKSLIEFRNTLKYLHSGVIVISLHFAQKINDEELTYLHYKKVFELIKTILD